MDYDINETTQKEKKALHASTGKVFNFYLNDFVLTHLMLMEKSQRNSNGKDRKQNENKQETVQLISVKNCFETPLPRKFLSNKVFLKLSKFLFFDFNVFEKKKVSKKGQTLSMLNNPLILFVHVMF